MSPRPILPSAVDVLRPAATLGVMGGGQLGRMFVHAAQRMGYFTAVLDPDPASPAGLVSHHHIQTDYLDEQGLAQLMQRCARHHHRVRERAGRRRWRRWARTGRWRPAPTAVAIAQDRVAGKGAFRRAAACPARRMR